MSSRSAPSVRWQKEQRKKRVKYSRSLCWKIFIAIIIFFFLALSGKAYQVISGATWLGKTQFNLIINSSPIVLVSFNPVQQTINIISIPGETMFQAAHGYGQLRAGAIFSLGEMEGKKGGELLSKSLQENLGAPIDGWINAGPTKEGPTETWLREIITGSLKRKLESNLNQWDLIQLWWRQSLFCHDKVSLINLGEEGVSEEYLLSDGSRAFRFDPIRFSSLAKKLFKEETIIQEDLSVAFVNGTTHPGLATRASQILDNLGGRVVEVGDWEGHSDACQIRSDKPLLKTFTSRKLSKIFNCYWVSEDKVGFRAEIVIILGEDYWQTLNRNYR